MTLSERFETAVRLFGDRRAFVQTDGCEVTYRELAELASRARARLDQAGVQPGDRVGLYFRKSIDLVAAIFGILDAGAVYVPADSSGTAIRAAAVFSDCQASVVFTERSKAPEIKVRCAEMGDSPRFIDLDFDRSPQLPMRSWPLPPRTDRRERSTDDLAYILYTSGSTGAPKGVALSHANAEAFIGWSISEFKLGPEDRLSMHAPFHFDLSVFDIHATVRAGATGFLIDDSTAKNPRLLTQYVTQWGLTVWYSVPSVLRSMISFSDLNEKDHGSLRLVLFAGEEFPISPLRELVQKLPQAVFYNLYGPTETNVCTSYRLPPRFPDSQTHAFPIGSACPYTRARVGPEGELLISGESVMRGYWNTKAEGDVWRQLDGEKWYRTGDVVREPDPGCYVYAGRLDRMIKRRGIRIEPAEVETCLRRYPGVEDAAAFGHRQGDDICITAFLEILGAKPSIMELKKHCARYLPVTMIPDRFRVIAKLPRTTTSKIDLQKLKEMLEP